MSQISSSPEFSPTISIGLDVHKRTIQLAALQGKDWVFERTFPTDKPGDLRKALVKLAKKAPVRACYEASGAGFVLHRLLTDWGIPCQVIAPSLIPVRPGEKKKCDRLDAQRLAQYQAAGMLTAVNVPTAEDESDRSLVRCRFAFRKDITRLKHRIVKFLDVSGMHYSGTAWTVEYRKWLASLTFPFKENGFVFRSYLEQLISTESRLSDLDAQIQQLADSSKYRSQVQVLRGFRGVETLTAMVFLTELGDISRFAAPNRLMAYLGLVPKVNQSGESDNRAKGITKGGNTAVRHVLVQAAWKYVSYPRLTPGMTKKLCELPSWAADQSLKAQKRLHSRFQHLEKSRGRFIAIPAVARELGCFLAFALRTLKEQELKAKSDG